MSAKKPDSTQSIATIIGSKFPRFTQNRAIVVVVVTLICATVYYVLRTKSELSNKAPDNISHLSIDGNSGKVDSHISNTSSSHSIAGTTIDHGLVVGNVGGNVTVTTPPPSNGQSGNRITKLVNDKWTIKVYDFVNDTNDSEHNKIGNRFPGFILDDLINHHLEAKTRDNKKMDIRLLGTRGGMAPDAFRELRAMAPAICIAGYVDEADNLYEIHIRIIWAIADGELVDPDTRFVRTYQITKQLYNMKLVALQAASDIRAHILEYYESAFSRR
jgi:hypothetical protein